MSPKALIQKIKNDYSRQNNTEAALSSLANATQTLASDLYEKDTHFIFELIQNAEDNSYSSTNKPSLSFKLKSSPPTIVIENNEQGFSPEHVQAICAVGLSTKKKSEGYIGEKGIGFKSVFRVTNRPEIHSKGFHFSLPENHPSGLGYITPEWIDKPSEEIKDGITTIVLPVNNDKWPQEKIASALQDIEPETILFLKKLQSVEIEIEGKEPYRVSVEKDISRYPLVKLSYLKKTKQKEDRLETFYWCAEKEFEKPAGINPEKRKGISKRPVSVAIPLAAGHKGKLFAYLPVYEETGIPFLINGDFLLVSSREGVKSDEKWNHWLRDCIAEVYTQALLSCLKCPDLSLEQRISAYGSIPRVTRIPFLTQIIENIRGKLKEEKCLLTMSEELEKPSSVKRASSEFRSLFLESEDKPQHLKKDILLIHEKIEAFPDQMNFLEVKQLQTPDILACLEDKKWLSHKTKPWLVKLYIYLESRQGIPERDLRSRPILPVRSPEEKIEHLSCDAEQPIYFHGKVSLKDIPACAEGLASIAFLDPDLHSLIDKEKNAGKIKKWLQDNLSVHEFSIGKYRVDVLDKISTPAVYNALTEEQILKVTDFILEDEDLSTEKAFPILLESGRRILLPKASIKVVVPKKHNPKTGWQHIWRSESDKKHFVVLSDKYDNDALKKMVGYNIVQNYPFASDDWFFDQKGFPSLLKEKNNVSKDTSLSLVSWITASQDVSPSIAEALIDFSWLPVKIKKKEATCEPPKAFLGKEAIREILGDDMPLFNDGLFSNEVLTALEIKTDIDYETLLNTLESYSGDKNASQKALVKIYSELAHRTEDHNRGIRQHFDDKRLIFMPDRQTWHTLSNCLWKDCSLALGDDFAYLENPYPKLKDFFVDTLGIKESADPESFADRWLILQKSKAQKNTEGILSEIYQAIYPIIESDDKPKWWWKLKTAKVYTVSGTFEEAKKVFYPDDGEYQEIFNFDNVKFAWKPKEGSSLKWAKFYNALDVHPISECVEESLEKYSGENCQQPKRLTGSAALMIAAWIREKDEAKYDSLRERGLFKKLLSVKEAYSDNPIRVKFSLESEGFQRATHKNYPVFWDDSKNVLVIDSSIQSEIKRYIARHISKKVLPSRHHDLSDWIENILGAQDTSRARERGWSIPAEISPTKEPVRTDERDELGANDAPFSSTDEEIERPQDAQDNGMETKPDNSASKTPSTKKSLSGANDDAPDDSAGDSDDSETEEDSHTNSPKEALDLKNEILAAFNKDGKVELSDNYLDDDFYNDGNLRNPALARGRMRDRHSERISNEPENEERRKKTQLSILEPLDPETRAYLENLYAGKCQICQETFPQRDGSPFFMATHIIERKKARFLDDHSNTLCLCPKHFAQWRHGAVACPTILEDIKNGNQSISVTICGQNCIITFKEKHLVNLQELLNAHEEQSESEDTNPTISQAD